MRVAAGVDDGDHNNGVSPLHIEDAKWKATSEGATNTAIQHLILSRVTADRSEGSFDSEEKLGSKTSQLRFVPIVSFC